MEKEIVNKKKVIFGIAIPLGIALSVVHALAVSNGWYHLFPWIDVPIHFLWTIVVWLVVYWLLDRSPKYASYFSRGFLIFIVAAMFITTLGGVLWELGESLYDNTVSLYNIDARPAQVSLSDTLSDLLINILGGLVLAIFVYLRYHKNDRIHD